MKAEPQLKLKSLLKLKLPALANHKREPEIPSLYFLSGNSELVGEREPGNVEGTSEKDEGGNGLTVNGERRKDTESSGAK